MAEFAKAQLLKYGWTEGKGLGKNENGIAEALKPKLKFDTSGVGHKDSDFQWWDSIYDKALNNIVLEKKSDEVVIKAVKENAFNISSSKSGMDTSKKNNHLRYGNFLKTSTLKDGTMMKDNTCETVEDDDTKDNPTIVKMTDEELFKACGGRTAHKGARHGLNLSGKLARIAEQERQLLAGPYLKCNDKSSQSKEVRQKKKKKRRKVLDSELFKDDSSTKSDEESMNCKEIRQKKKKKKKITEAKDYKALITNNDDLNSDDDSSFMPIHTEDYKPCKKTCRKVKRKIHDLSHQLNKSCMIDDSAENKQKSLKKKNMYAEYASEEKVQKSNRKTKESKRKYEEEIIDVCGFDDNDIPMIMEPRPKRIRTSTGGIGKHSLADEYTRTSCNSNDVIIKVGHKRKKDKDHCSSKSSYCVRHSETDKLKTRYRLKKHKKLLKKKERKVDKLTESLLAVNLNTPEENVTNNSESSQTSRKNK